jgi:hypothetical protein
MLARSLLHGILDDDALTRNLGDAEARLLVEWLVEQAEQLEGLSAEEADRGVRRLCRRGRSIARFVSLWCTERGAATQLAGAERFEWPLPDGPRAPDELMQAIVRWEVRNQKLARGTG